MAGSNASLTRTPPRPTIVCLSDETLFDEVWILIRCVQCHRMDEDGAHLLLTCKPVKNLWRALCLEDCRKMWAEFSDPRLLVEAILQQSQNTKLLCISLCSNWWNKRNKINSEGKSFSHDQVLAQIRRSAREFQDFFSKQSMQKTVSEAKWKVPNPNVKLNIDGSFLAGNGSGGWGFLARDSDGDVCGSGTGRLGRVRDALHAEAEACIQALSFAQQSSILKIQVETDAQLLVQAVNSNEQDLTPNGVPFQEIKALAFFNFSYFSISYCPRSCNKVADALATSGAKMVSEP